METTAEKALRQATEKMGSTIVDEQRVGYGAPAVLRRLEKSKSVQDMAELTDTQFEQWLTDSKEGKRILTPDQHCAITIRLKSADSESLSNVVKVHRLMNSWITNTTNKLLLGSDKPAQCVRERQCGKGTTEPFLTTSAYQREPDLRESQSRTRVSLMVPLLALKNKYPLEILPLNGLRPSLA